MGSNPVPALELWPLDLDLDFSSWPAGRRGNCADSVASVAQLMSVLVSEERTGRVLAIIRALRFSAAE